MDSFHAVWKLNILFYSKIIPVDDAIGEPIITEKADSCAPIEISGGHSDNEKQKSDKHQKQTLKQNDGNQQNAKAEGIS